MFFDKNRSTVILIRDCSTFLLLHLHTIILRESHGAIVGAREVPPGNPCEQVKFRVRNFYGKLTEHFTNLEPQNPSVDVSEQHKVTRSTTFQALKLWKGWSRRPWSNISQILCLKTSLPANFALFSLPIFWLQNWEMFGRSLRDILHHILVALGNYDYVSGRTWWRSSMEPKIVLRRPIPLFRRINEYWLNYQPYHPILIWSHRHILASIRRFGLFVCTCVCLLGHWVESWTCVISSSVSNSSNLSVVIPNRSVFGTLYAIKPCFLLEIWLNYIFCGSSR